MGSGDEATAYDQCVGQLDQVANHLRSRIISRDEYEQKALHALSNYLEADRPEDDIDLLIQYARLPIEQDSASPLTGDRNAVDDFNRQVQGLFHYPASRANLQERLDSVSERIASGDGSGIDDLRSLCHSGWRDHPHIFMFRDNVNATLQLAFELGAVDALFDAVAPSTPEPGPIASGHLFYGTVRTYALNLLGTLATHGDQVGDQAIDALVRLTGFLDIAAEAALRLPAYRLSDEQRTAIYAHLESFVDLMGKDPFLLPTDNATRVPHILRSVLWLANDASHL